MHTYILTYILTYIHTYIHLSLSLTMLRICRSISTCCEASTSLKVPESVRWPKLFCKTRLWCCCSGEDCWVSEICSYATWGEKNMPPNTPNPQFSAILNVDIMSVNRASTRMSTSAPKPRVFELLTPRVYSQSVSILPESQTYSPSQGPAPNFR